jgi:hypothetical protein
VVVTEQMVWVSDPGVAVVRRVDPDAEPRTPGRPMGATSP